MPLLNSTEERIAIFESLGSSLPLRDQIVQDLLGKIESGELHEGDRLLPERELATAYQVSRTAVRDALRTLSGLGVVSIRHGQGMFVRAGPGIALGQALWEPLVVQPTTVSWLFDVRKSLEVEASGWAAERADANQKANLLTLVEEAKAVVVQGEEVNLSLAATADQAFHAGLIVASENPIAGRIMLNLLDLLEAVRKKSLAIPGRAWLSVLDHERIAQRIASGDVLGARAAMRDHLSTVESAILAAFEEGPEAGSSNGDSGNHLH